MTTDGPPPSEGPPPTEGIPEPAPPTPGPPSPQPTVPTPPTPPTLPIPPVVGQPTTSGMSGCAKAAIIGGVIVVVLGGLVAVAVFVFFNRVADNVEGSFEDSPCEYISNQAASDAVGANVEAISGDSAVAAILGLIRDTRLLEGAPFCFISDDDSGIQVWVSVYDGSDAADVFAAGAEVAGGQVVSETSTDSGSLTVETGAFRGDDVPDLGNEAFCVDIGMTASGGVFARSDDRVVFVSALAFGEDPGSEVFTNASCERAIPIARALLG